MKREEDGKCGGAADVEVLMSFVSQNERWGGYCVCCAYRVFGVSGCVCVWWCPGVSSLATLTSLL